MGLSKDAKRKGPQTTLPGTKAHRPMVVGVTRPDGSWSGHKTWGEVVVTKQGTRAAKREQPDDKS